MTAPTMTNPVALPDLLQLGDDFAARWAGVPFQWGGRTRAGVDCWGLVLAFHADVKREALPDWARPAKARSWVARTLAGAVPDHWRPLPSPADGCIVKALAHVGIYWRGGVLHATETQGVVDERLQDFLLVYPSAEFGEFVR